MDEVDKWEPKPLEVGEVDKEEQVKPKTPKPKASRLQKVKDLMKDEGEVAADGAAIVPVEGTLINDWVVGVLHGVEVFKELSF